MPLTGNAIDNNALASLTRRAGPAVTSAIQHASQKTGVNFAYLMEKAAAESSFSTNIQAKSSSARGLYQFISSTWLQMINRYGEKYGLGEYADKISDTGKVGDPATKKAILALRDDPEISALMAGEFAAENKRTLVRSGIAEKDIGSTELYLAHFLGAGAASQFIKANKENPLMAAADIFPRAAKANYNVFYNSKTQQARSLGEVYAFFDKKFSHEPSTTPEQVLVAENTGTKATPHYAPNSIMRTLPMIDYNTNNDTMADMMALINDGMMYDMNRLNDYSAFNKNKSSSPLPASRNAMIADPAMLMMLAGNMAPIQSNTAASSSTNEAREERKDPRSLKAYLVQHIMQAL